MNDWVRIPLDSPLYRAPASTAHAPVLARLDALPLAQLEWSAFESFLLQVLRDVLGLRDPRLYGEPGQDQQGIDMVATDSHGNGFAVQSKRYQAFRAGDLRAAVNVFRERERPFPISRFVVAVSSAARTTSVVAALRALQDEAGDVELDLWDAITLSEMVRPYPHIVIRFFGEPTARAFCGEFDVDIPSIPNADALIVSDAISQSVEAVLGVDELLRRVDEAPAAEDALRLLEDAQERLREARFDAHASRHEPRRTKLLLELGRGAEAARAVLDELWAALEQGRTTTAQIVRARLSAIAENTEWTEVSEMDRVGRVALAIHLDPFGRPPRLPDATAADYSDRARLMVLAGETALANDASEWLQGSVAPLTEIIGRTPAGPLRVRLQILLAEATGEWAEILSAARRRKLSAASGGLVAARFARYQVIRGAFADADSLWEEAAASASQARQWTDARTWIRSTRVLRAEWRLSNDDELLAMEIALSEMGPSVGVITRSEHAVEDAQGSLREGRHRPAAIAAQRSLRDAVSGADWSGERKSRTILAAAFAGSDEPVLAAVHLARAGASKQAATLTESFPNTFIDVVPLLDAENYAVVGTAYRMLAAQADLIPDEKVNVILAHAEADLAAAEAGELVDLTHFASSRYNNAIKVISRLSERIPLARADTLLSHFEQQPPLDDSYYRYHDKDEANAVAGFARSHAELADRAITHLVGLLSRSQSARTDDTVEVLDRFRAVADPLLRRVQGSGKGWAREMLAFHTPSEVDPDEAAEAVRRLTTPLVHTAGVHRVGTNAVGDSLLVKGQPGPIVERVVEELIRRAADARVDGADKGRYLLAAANVSDGMDAPARARFFTSVAAFAMDPVPSHFNDTHGALSHKLSAVRLIDSSTGGRGQAIYLASILAVTDDHRAQVRRLVYSMLGAGSDYWPSRALQNLGEFIVDDLAFLSGQSWSMRSLAALMWTRHGEHHAHIGARIAADDDVRVRETLARGLRSVTVRPWQTAVRDILGQDPSYRVRNAAPWSD